MTYGVNFEGNLGNTCFSEKQPSIVYMGKASIKSYGGDWRCRGCSYLYRTTYNQFHSFGFGSYCVGSGLNQCYDSIVGDWGNCHAPRIDDHRLCVFEVESYEKPIVFIHYSDPDKYGGIPLATVNNGNTGPRGYPKWDIHMLLNYNNSYSASAGNYTGAASSMTLYCFSKLPDNYTSSTTIGMEIKDENGNVMYHSDWKPAVIKGMIDGNTGNSYNWPSALNVYSSMTKFAYLARDYGRFVSKTSACSHYFTFHNPLCSFRYDGGNNFTARLGRTPLYQFQDWSYTTNSDGDFLGPSKIIMPIIDGADYD